MVITTIRIEAKNVNHSYQIFRERYPNYPINYDKTLILCKATNKKLGFYQIEYIKTNGG